MTVQSVPGTESVVLEGIRWTTFEALLDDLGEHRGLLTYDGGRFEIMSPSKKHEAVKKLLARLIERYTFERGIDIESLGSMTFRRPDLAQGIEPDECYYVQNASTIREHDDLDLTRDPPPDLVVEAAITRRVIERLPIYAAMGVPEVWRRTWHSACAIGPQAAPLRTCPHLSGRGVSVQRSAVSDQLQTRVQRGCHAAPTATRACQVGADRNVGEARSCGRSALSALTAES